MQDGVNLYGFQYLQPIAIPSAQGLKNNDSLFINWARSSRHFQLAEKTSLVKWSQPLKGTLTNSTEFYERNAVFPG
jgi:hypothetical protein